MKTALFCLLMTASLSVVSAQEENLIAVIDLTCNGLSEEDANNAIARVRAELINSGRYTVIDRRAQAAMLEEKGFSQTGCTSTECAVRAGELLNVKRVVVGSFDRMAASYQLTLKIVDAVKGESIKSGTGEFKGDLTEILNKGLWLVTNQIIAAENERLAGLTPKQWREKKEVKLGLKGIPVSISYVNPFLNDTGSNELDLAYGMNVGLDFGNPFWVVHLITAVQGWWGVVHPENDRPYRHSYEIGWDFIEFRGIFMEGRPVNIFAGLGAGMYYQNLIKVQYDQLGEKLPTRKGSTRMKLGLLADAGVAFGTRIKGGLGVSFRFWDPTVMKANAMVIFPLGKSPEKQEEKKAEEAAAPQ